MTMNIITNVYHCIRRKKTMYNKLVISVSDAIRKPLLAEAQAALGKQKIRSVERGYLSHC